MSDGYHHGNLRRTLLEEAAGLVAEIGPAGTSLRELARRAGVSHAAPMHHFKDRRGLFTALAIEGLESLAVEMRTAEAVGFDQAAVAYVLFALRNPGQYAVMHRMELLDESDPDLVAARAATMRALQAGVESIPDERRGHLEPAEAAQVAWALVHGLASLATEGRITEKEIEPLTRRAAHQLFG